LELRKSDRALQLKNMPAGASQHDLMKEASCSNPGDLNLIRSAPVRDVSLDFTKGALVLLMVLYHWLNYFVSVHGFGYRYIRFIMPSFVFLAGFLVSNLLATRAGLSTRLFLRGIKLLALFTALNVGVAWLVGKKLPTGSPEQWLAATIDAVPSIYVSGQGAAFFVLAPISYALMIVALLCKVREISRVHFLIPGSLAFALVFALVLSGVRLPALELVGVSLLGFVIGLAPAARLRESLQLSWPWLLLAYGVHLGALTFWGVPYPLQMVSVCLNLSLIYCLAALFQPAGHAMRLMTLLGQYTLVGYVGQIGILQILTIVFRNVDLGPGESAAALVATLLLTIALIVVIDLFRRRSRPVDSLYRLVFA
jgi:fucose 4-O-acetylase-like acetyltransferase